jgi:hypothetical protein
MIPFDATLPHPSTDYITTSPVAWLQVANVGKAAVGVSAASHEPFPAHPLKTSRSLTFFKKLPNSSPHIAKTPPQAAEQK